MPKLKKAVKEIRCKKCNKLLAIIDGDKIEFTIKTKAKIFPTEYELTCRSCGEIRRGKR